MHSNCRWVFEKVTTSEWPLGAVCWVGVCWALKASLFLSYGWHGRKGHLPFSGWGLTGSTCRYESARLNWHQPRHSCTHQERVLASLWQCQEKNDARDSGGLCSRYFIAVPWVSALETSSSSSVIGSTALAPLSQLLLLFAFTFVTSFCHEWCLVYAECIPDGTTHLSAWSLCQ